MKKLLVLFAVLVLVLASVTSALAAGGFDQNGYNDNGNIFNGTGSSWCQGKLGLSQSACDTYMSPYQNDKLVMKWNEAWDACNKAGGNDPAACAGAWTSNEWNGAFLGGSGEVWHYKIIWVGSGGSSSQYWKPGGYSIWGNYEVVMDQGMSDGAHYWLTHATPTGYGN